MSCGFLTKLMVVIVLPYMYVKSRAVILTVHGALGQLYLNETEKEKLAERNLIPLAFCFIF